MACDERAPMERALARVRAGEADPACRSCGGMLKSATISFGQSLVREDLLRCERVAKTCDLMLAVGIDARGVSGRGRGADREARGARIAIVNGESTEMDDLADAVLRGSIGEILPALVAAD